MSDEIIEKKKPDYFLVIILVGVIGLVGVIFLGLDEDTINEMIEGDTNIIIHIEDEIKGEINKVAEKENRFQCEQWVEEGRYLVIKNQPITDTKDWTTEDKLELDRITEQVLLKCTLTADDFTHSEFNNCYDIYYSIRVLLSKMTDMEINSLSEDDQTLYQQKYSLYHENSCDLVKNDMIAIYNQTAR